MVQSQIEQLKQRYERYRVPEKEFNPHYRAMSSLQNLGSVVNTAFSVYGEDLFICYVTEPELVHHSTPTSYNSCFCVWIISPAWTAGRCGMCLWATARSPCYRRHSIGPSTKVRIAA